MHIAWWANRRVQQSLMTHPACCRASNGTGCSRFCFFGGGLRLVTLSNASSAWSSSLELDPERLEGSCSMTGLVICVAVGCAAWCLAAGCPAASKGMQRGCIPSRAAYWQCSASDHKMLLGHAADAASSFICLLANATCCKALLCQPDVAASSPEGLVIAPRHLTGMVHLHLTSGTLMLKIAVLTTYVGAFLV